MLKIKHPIRIAAPNRVFQVTVFINLAVVLWKAGLMFQAKKSISTAFTKNYDRYYSGLVRFATGDGSIGFQLGRQRPEVRIQIDIDARTVSMAPLAPIFRHES